MRKFASRMIKWRNALDAVRKFRALVLRRLKPRPAGMICFLNILGDLEALGIWPSVARRRKHWPH